jgi:opacity protein-like surface antigen
MFKRLFAAAAALIGLSLAVPAQAQTFYGTGSFGTSFVQGQANAIPLSLGVGAEFNKYLRAELDLDAYISGVNSNSLGAVSTVALVPKGFVQAPVSLGSFTLIPYLSAGFGLASITGPGSITGQLSGLWTVGGGVMAPITKSFSMGVGYEYAASTSPVVQQFYYTGLYQANTVKLTGRINF